MLTRTQGWVGTAIMFGTIISAFWGMNQPFIGSWASVAVATVYGAAFMVFLGWVLVTAGVSILALGGRHPRLGVAAATIGCAILGFGAAAVTPGLVYTRFLGEPGKWPFTVESSRYVGYQKWGPNHCHAISFIETSWPMAKGDLCLQKPLKPGTHLMLEGKQSFMGTWYEKVWIVGNAGTATN